MLELLLDAVIDTAKTLPFLFGVYPYTTHTEKQKEAMALAHVPHVSHTIYEITRSLVSRLLPA